MSKNTFVPIEWQIDRNDGYLNINCFRLNSEGKWQTANSCFSHVTEGFDLAACGCDPKQGLRVQVFDKHGEILAQSQWVGEVEKIVLGKTELGEVAIWFENY